MFAGILKATAVTLALAVAGFMATPVQAGGHVSVGIGIGLGGYAPAPVYAPYYQPYYAPAPVYYAPPPVAVYQPGAYAAVLCAACICCSSTGFMPSRSRLLCSGASRVLRGSSFFFGFHSGGGWNNGWHGGGGGWHH